MTGPAENDDHAVRDAAASAVSLVADGESQAAFDALMSFLCRPEQGRNSTELLLTMLFEASATMASAVGVFEGSLEPVMIGAHDDDLQLMNIDDVAPVERTFVRALLAEIHDDRQATQSQIRLAFATGDPVQIATLIMRALAGVVALRQACAERDLPVPHWLAEHG